MSGLALRSRSPPKSRHLQFLTPRWSRAGWLLDQDRIPTRLKEGLPGGQSRFLRSSATVYRMGGTPHGTARRVHPIASCPALEYSGRVGGGQSLRRACQLAKTDPKAALVAARGIDDPWYRTLALAWVARFSDGPGTRKILEEAQGASRSENDRYRVAASGAWWLRAMIELGYRDEALRKLPGLSDVAATIAHPVSRLDALFLLFQAVFDVDRGRKLVLGRLIEAARAAHSWKAGDRLRTAVLMLAVDHPTEAEQVIQAMPEGKYKRQAVRRVASKEHHLPRRFFW